MGENIIFTASDHPAYGGRTAQEGEKEYPLKVTTKDGAEVIFRMGERSSQAMTEIINNFARR